MKNNCKPTDGIHLTMEDVEHAGKVWPGRYIVRAEVRYRGRRGSTGVMQVIAYQPEMPEEESTALLANVGITPDSMEWKRYVSQAKDTFSAEQAEALEAYMNTREGTRAYRKEAVLPAPGGLGASAIPTLPSFRDGLVYRLYTERGYPLPFKVETINLKTYLYMSRLFDEMRSTLDGARTEREP